MEIQKTPEERIYKLVRSKGTPSVLINAVLKTQLAHK